jgi:hypothetical protein
VIRHQLQEARRTAWPSADQEKEKMRYKADQKTVTLEGRFTDPKVLMKVAMDQFNNPSKERLESIP